MEENLVRLFQMDCAKVVTERRIAPASLDLIYIDPPFNSKRNYSITSIGKEGEKEVRRFTDVWQGGYRTYIAYMRPRIRLLRDLLKDDGVFIYHCDDAEAGHVETLIMDEVFGSPSRKVNNIYWQRTTAAKSPGRKYGRVADQLLVYSPSSNGYTFNVQRGQVSERHLKYFTGNDERGRFYSRDITAPGWRTGSSGKTFEVLNDSWTCPNTRNIAIPRTFLAKLGIEVRKIESTSDFQKVLHRLEQEGLLAFGKKGGLNYKQYLSTVEGKTLTNIWIDIAGLKGKNEEWVNFPTQKPIPLLDRLIRTFTDEGDLVGDFFLGSGTTAVAALRLGRRFVGCDTSPTALSVARDRIAHDPQLQPDLFNRGPRIDIELVGVPRTVEELEAMNAKAEFADFIIREFGGTPNPIKTGDMGIDGWDIDMNPIQVKRSKKIGRNVVDNFRAAIERDRKTSGTIIAWSFGKGTYKEAARLEQDDNIKIVLMPIDKVVEVNQSPNVSVEATPIYGPPPLKVKFVAEGNDPDGEVINFAWDFRCQEEFSPDILRDARGEAQHTYDEEGEFLAMVEVTDNQGARARASVQIVVKENGL